MVDQPVNQETDQVVNEVVQLTESEMNVFRLNAKGMNTEQIAASLSLSTGTVKGYFGTIYGKFSAAGIAVEDRTQLALLAIGSKAVEPPPCLCKVICVSPKRGGWRPRVFKQQAISQ